MAGLSLWRRMRREERGERRGREERRARAREGASCRRNSCEAPPGERTPVEWGAVRQQTPYRLRCADGEASKSKQGIA